MSIKKSPGEPAPKKVPPKQQPKKEETKKKTPVKKPKAPPKKKEPKKKVGAHGNKKDPITKLTLQQEHFVRVYCGIEQGYYWDSFDETLTRERWSCIGNATQSYLNAYPDSGYHSARSSASDLLANPIIRSRIKDTLTIAGWSKENAKLQHLSVMNQSGELPSKMRAIELFYKVEGELPDDKIKVEISDDDRELLESVLSSRKKSVATIDDEIITTPSDLSSDYPSSNDKGESD